MDPNSPLNHHHSLLGRAPPYDAPITSPFSEYIPEWERCGKHNCNTHHHMAKAPGRLVLGLDQPVVLHMWHCYGCTRPYNTVSLHFLPCSHAVCRDCLDKAATHAHNTIQRNKNQVDDILSNAFLRREMAAEVDDPDVAAQLAEDEGTIFAAAYALAGFTCCGQDMRLTRFLYCMDGQVAMRFWCDYEYMLTPPEKRNYCGWPDCRAFVPGKCGFIDKSGLPTMLHCPECRGNLLLIEDEDTSPESRQGMGDNVWMPIGEPFPRQYDSVEV
ncbi:hypothetical protein NKR19_g7442 [Coniochaeta hoffmannii]|uniref:RING-type domain-containing protein n=1 Tax=Coniochaeta hoffmannii TaxID=91930 RepID=A0AA38R970_9PEZI|nr:hypothetical protein NKR19_g7442 [Coniochaeta hoffmannii]